MSDDRVGALLQRLVPGPDPRSDLAQEIWDSVAQELPSSRLRTGWTLGRAVLAAAAAAILLVASAVAISAGDPDQRVVTRPADGTTHPSSDPGAEDGGPSVSTTTSAIAPPTTRLPTTRSESAPTTSAARTGTAGPERTSAVSPGSPPSGTPTPGPSSAGAPPAPGAGASWIAFKREEPTGSSVWIMRDDGSAQRRVTSGSAPSWSPDGRSLAVADGGVIALVDVESGRRTNVDHGGGFANFPAWSPDGRWIAVQIRLGGSSVGCVASDPCRNVVRLVAADGGAKVDLVSGGTPSWSPDGNRLVYVNVGDQSCDAPSNHCLGSLRVIDADGTDDRALGPLGGQPGFSPDGASIVYQKRAAGVDTQVIAVIGADGKGDRNVTTTSGNDWTPAWTPDGRIVHALAHSTGSTMRIMNADGTAARELTSRGATFDEYPDVIRRPGTSS